MANKHEKWGVQPLSVQRNENENPMRYCYTPTYMAKIQKTGGKDEHNDMEHLELSCIAGEKINWYNFFGKLILATKVEY